MSDLVKRLREQAQDSARLARLTADQFPEEIREFIATDPRDHDTWKAADHIEHLESALSAEKIRRELAERQRDEALGALDHIFYELNDDPTLGYHQWAINHILTERERIKGME